MPQRGFLAQVSPDQEPASSPKWSAGTTPAALGRSRSAGATPTTDSFSHHPYKPRASTRLSAGQPQTPASHRHCLAPRRHRSAPDPSILMARVSNHRWARTTPTCENHMEILKPVTPKHHAQFLTRKEHQVVRSDLSRGTEEVTHKVMGLSISNSYNLLFLPSNADPGMP